MADGTDIGPVGGAHVPVLEGQVVGGLRPRPGARLVDATIGLGGHAKALLEAAPGTELLGIDRDPAALAIARARLASFGARVRLREGGFGRIREHLAAVGWDAVDGLLVDLGVSSLQLDDPARGFSFRADGPLDMRMDPTRGESAAEFLARADAPRIAEVLRDYGEERFASAIARAIVAEREAGRAPRSTRALAQICARAVRTREAGQDPATRSFQALRILVNGELDEIERVLEIAVERLAPGGRLVVIAFHSLEDRIVKRFIARESRSEPDRRAPFAPERVHRLRAVGRVLPGAREVAANPRARSAVMRVAERLGDGP
jgi:16S rRNA (cytosine1402-N4)-methyltransferase